MKVRSCVTSSKHLEDTIRLCTYFEITIKNYYCVYLTKCFSFMAAVKMLNFSLISSKMAHSLQMRNFIETLSKLVML